MSHWLAVALIAATPVASWAAARLWIYAHRA